ncbi:MAG TPA: hypothetical protein VIC08_08615 [Cellvibrionaceae bacterium]
MHYKHKQDNRQGYTPLFATVLLDGMFASCTTDKITYYWLVMDKRINDLILNLHDGSMHLAPDEFQSWALK